MKEMKRFLLVLILVLIGLDSYCQSTAYIGDTLVVQTKTVEGYFIKYMFRGNAIRTDSSADPLIINQSIRAGSKRKMLSQKEAVLREYVAAGWNIKGKSHYQEASTYILERGDVGTGNYCSMTLSFIGKKLEGKSEYCL